MPRHISRLQWMSVPKQTRVNLALALGLKPSKFTEVASTQHGMKEISDGFTDDDLLGITTEKMQEYMLSPNENFDELWMMCIDKATPREWVEVDTPLQELPVEEPKAVPERLVNLKRPEDVLPQVINTNPTKNGKAKTK